MKICSLKSFNWLISQVSSRDNLFYFISGNNLGLSLHLSVHRHIAIHEAVIVWLHSLQQLQTLIRWFRGLYTATIPQLTFFNCFFTATNQPLLSSWSTIYHSLFSHPYSDTSGHSPCTHALHPSHHYHQNHPGTLSRHPPKPRLRST